MMSGDCMLQHVYEICLRLVVYCRFRLICVLQRGLTLQLGHMTDWTACKFSQSSVLIEQN